MHDYDLAVIGAGAAGNAAALTAARLGARVVLIEKSRQGGHSLWSGSVPIYSLIRSASVFDTVKRAEEFGVHLENQRMVWGALQLRLAAVRDDIRQLQREKLAEAKVTTIIGKARFEGDHTLAVEGKDGEEKIQAPQIIVAAGAKPRTPDIPGLAEIKYVTAEQFFDLKTLPQSWIVLSAEPSGCEIAQALARLGRKVTLLQTSRSLLPDEDPEISAHAEKILRNEGVTVHCDVHIWRAMEEGEKKQLEFEVKGKIQTAQASEILVLAGRKVRLDDLNLEIAGIRHDERGIITNECLQAAPGVWACGEVTGKSPATHHSIGQGQLTAENALSPVANIWDAYATPFVVATDPAMARVGLTEAQAKREHAHPAVSHREFSRLDRAIIDGEAHGFCKIITTSQGRIIGAHIIGPGAGELIHLFAPAVREGQSLGEFSATMPLYPSLSKIATSEW